MCRSAVNDGSCSPWVMCSCSVVSGNQIRDSILIMSGISGHRIILLFVYRGHVDSLSWPFYHVRD